MTKYGAVAVLLGALAAPTGAQVPDEFTNLKLFPEDIGKRELMSVMQKFSGALGVRCNHCHLGPDNLEGMDFATDQLETKRVARAMMKMTGEINDKLMPTTGRQSLMRVQCVTCHRGVARPERLDDVLLETVEKDGVEAALERYGELRDEYYGAGAYDFSAATLNEVAENLAREQGDMDGAVAVMKLNLELNPDSAYSHILLGQIYLHKGDKAAGVASLERAVKLEPDNGYAKRMLERAKAED